MLPGNIITEFFVFDFIECKRLIGKRCNNKKELKNFDFVLFAVKEVQKVVFVEGKIPRKCFQATWPISIKKVSTG